MAEIHPTSIVGDEVTLADDVRIGPWCILDGPVTLGPGARLLHSVTLQGPLAVGRDCVFYPGTAIGYAPQDLKYDPDHPGAGVVIGDRNVFREQMTIHRATGERPTKIGDDNYFMVNAHVAHDCAVGNRCMFANGAGLAGHVEVGDQVILGGGAMIHQFCRAGRLAMVSGLSGTSQDIPPFCTSYRLRRVSSLNIVGLRRAGLRDHIRPLRQAFDLLYRSRHTRVKAIEAMESAAGADPLVREFIDFVRISRRGITPYARSNVGDDMV